VRDVGEGALQSGHRRLRTEGACRSGSRSLFWRC
jgi:hypothetical protein